MFSGIVEATGTVVRIEQEQSNIHFSVEAPFVHELAIDQSIAHNGVCLTVVSIDENVYTVTAIAETLQRTELGEWKVGTKVNLERCLRLSDRIDGHMVQGHVDTTATCTLVEDKSGSWKYTFRYDHQPEWTTVPKGSICVNGVSLTVVDSEKGLFSVCIIPYTYEHTNFHTLQQGSTVNLEFDVIGKYVMRYMHIN
ncbi:MAG: riboflavin synthase, partial [Flavobacteriales bacterium]